MTVWAPCSDVIYHIWSHTGLCSSFHRTAQSEEWRQISPHDERQGADAPCTSNKAQTQFRERTDTWREVINLVPSNTEAITSRIRGTEEELVWSFIFELSVSEERGPLARACPAVPADHLGSVFPKAPHPHGAQRPALLNWSPAQCTPPQSWTSLLPWSRNHAQNQRKQKAKAKPQQSDKYRCLLLLLNGYGMFLY